MLEKHIRNGIIRYNQPVCISQKLKFQTIEFEISNYLDLVKNKTFALLQQRSPQSLCLLYARSVVFLFVERNFSIGV
jgi:hypothetical protein